MTEGLKADLKAIELRDKIYTKRFYKRSEMKKLPEFFQIGTVVEGNGPQKKLKKVQDGALAR